MFVNCAVAARCLRWVVSTAQSERACPSCPRANGKRTIELHFTSQSRPIYFNTDPTVFPPFFAFRCFARSLSSHSSFHDLPWPRSHAKRHTGGKGEAACKTRICLRRNRETYTQTLTAGLKKVSTSSHACRKQHMASAQCPLQSPIVPVPAQNLGSRVPRAFRCAGLRRKQAVSTTPT